jgi:uncharacterized delta-60 repeat protein
MRSNQFIRALLAPVCLCAAFTAAAAPGSIDFSVKTRIAGGNNEARALAVQPDGKYLTAGYARLGTQQFSIARYNTNGTLDSTFGGTGEILEPLGAGNAVATAVAVQADGKVVAAGYVNTGIQDKFAIARFTSTGILDTSFGGGGAATTVGANDARANGMAIQGDGKIVLAGSASDGSHQGFALVRYNTNATLDTAFGGTGEVVTPLGGVDSQANAVALQADGRIVVAGSAGGLMAIARFNSDGTLDTTFNAGAGYRTIGGGFTSATALAIQADGKIVAGGDASGSFGFVRLNSDGTFDTTFNGGGTQVVTFGGAATLASLAVQADGKIVAAGRTAGTSHEVIAFARLAADGSADNTFGSAGKATVSATSGDDYAYAMAALGDGRYLVAGGAVGSAGFDEELAMFQSTGAIDATFGSGGAITRDFGSVPSQAKAVAIQGDGKIVVAGFVDYEAPLSGRPEQSAAIVRYNTDGSLDTSFGTSGITLAGFQANAIAIQTDGKLVTAGRSQTGPDTYQIEVARYTTGGALDTSFGTGGLAQVSVHGVDDEGTSVAILPGDAGILVGGFTQNGTFTNAVVIRLTPSGTLDTGFNGSGISEVAMSTGSDSLNAIAIQSDGRIVGAGWGALSGSQDGFALLRLNADGSPDTGFGSSGVAVTPIGSFSSYAQGLVIQSDGRIVAGGRVFNGSNDDLVTVRYTTSGSLDSSYGSGGIATNDLGNHTRINALALLSNGEVAAAGETAGEWTAALYTTGGSLDSAFGTGGSTTFQVNGNAGSDVAYALAIQPSDGKWVIAGSGSGIIAVARVVGLTDAPPPPVVVQQAGYTLVPLHADFNGDGRSDLVFSRADNSLAIWLMDGTTVLDSATVLGAASGTVVTKIADFNGDGHSDLVRQFSDGSITVYLMNGLSIAGQAQVAAAGNGYTLQNVGDFDADGMADLVLLQADGSTAIWLMNGAAVKQATTIMSAAIAAGWYVTKVADFNGDGKSDLLWTNPTGGIGIWTMDGTTGTDKQVVFSNGSGWEAIATGDFNGDGKADVLFLNTTNGAIGMWLMNGTQALAKQSVFSAATGWSITQVADFNGDGKSDLLWTYERGDTGLWLMDGLYASNKQVIQNSGTGWLVTLTEDVNGDGKQDLLWTGTDGSAAGWLMDGMWRSTAWIIQGAGTGWGFAYSVGQNN